MIKWNGKASFVKTWQWKASRTGKINNVIRNDPILGQDCSVQFYTRPDSAGKADRRPDRIGWIHLQSSVSSGPKTHYTISTINIWISASKLSGRPAGGLLHSSSAPFLIFANAGASLQGRFSGRSERRQTSLNRSDCALRFHGRKVWIACLGDEHTRIFASYANWKATGKLPETSSGITGH